jgi:isoleucyl-tRNA synthetase
MAPILPFTTDEAWEAMPLFKDKEESVHLQCFPSLEEKWLDGSLFKEWEELVEIRETVLKELELARENKMIGNSLEARVSLKAPASMFELLKRVETELPALFITSQVTLEVHDGEDLRIEVAAAEGKKCQRCWNFSSTVGTSQTFPLFCKRCEDVVKENSG